MRTKMTGSDHIRKFLQRHSGKPVSAAQVKASHSSLKDRNISSALKEMPDVVQKGTCVCPVSGRKVLAFFLKENVKPEAKTQKKEEAKPATKEEKILSVKEKIRATGARCTALEHAAKKQQKHIAKLEAQVDQLKTAVAKALQLAETKLQQTEKKEAQVAAPEEIPVATHAPDNSPETAKVIAEISNKLSTFAELLRKLGAPVPTQSELPSIKAKTIEELQTALGDRALCTVRGKYEVGVEGEGFNLRYWFGAGAFAGRVNNLPVKGVGIKELLAVLPASKTNKDSFESFQENRPEAELPAPE